MQHIVQEAPPNESIDLLVSSIRLRYHCRTPDDDETCRSTKSSSHCLLPHLVNHAAVAFAVVLEEVSHGNYI
jgi:hypothetical protein